MTDLEELAVKSGVTPERVNDWYTRLRNDPVLLRAVAVKRSIYIPEDPTPKQVAFSIAPQLEVGYGGSAGSGKSSAILMAALQYVMEPDYSALILRRTYSDLNLPDSILTRAHKWLGTTDAVWEAQHNRFRFPSGALLQFGYLQSDKDMYRYDSAAFQFIAFDEAVQFHEHQYRFLFGRLRQGKNSRVPLRLRSGTNPGNIGHRWYKNRFILQHNDKDRLFIPAKFHENPGLNYESYAKSLEALTPLLRKQRQDGDWDAEEAGSIFKSEWMRFTDSLHPDQENVRRVRYWDLAATAPKKGRDPDWTVGALLSRDGRGNFIVEDIQRFRKDPAAVEDRVIETARADGRSTYIRIEQEPGSSGKMLVSSYERMLAGWNVAGKPARGSKVARWGPLAGQMSKGNVLIMNAPWTGDFVDEITSVTGVDGQGHDDQADAIAGAFAYFVQEAPLFNFGVSSVFGVIKK